MTIVPVNRPYQFIQAQHFVLDVCHGQIDLENGTITILKIIERIGDEDYEGDFIPREDGIKVFDVVICGGKLQELHQELLSCSLTVNCEGFCFVYTGSRAFPSKIGDGGYNYRLYDLFNWSKYGVVPSTNTTSSIWAPRNLPPPTPDDSLISSVMDSGYKVRQELNKSVIVSQVYRLNQHNFFIDCRDIESGRIVVWEVQAPGGKLLSLRAVAVVGNVEQRGELEVHGVSILGQMLRDLATELWARTVMVNYMGLCLLYTGDSFSNIKIGDGGFYYRLNDIFEWSKYDVKPPYVHGTAWLTRFKLDIFNVVTEESTIFELLEMKKEICLLENLLEEKNNKLRDCELKLKEKEREAFVLENSLKQKDEELEDCTLRLEKKDKRLKEKDQKLKVCRMKLKEKESELCVSKKQVDEKKQELKRCKSQLNWIQRELELSKSRFKQKDIELMQKEKEFESKLEQKDQELNRITKWFRSEEQRTNSLQLALDKINNGDDEKRECEHDEKSCFCRAISWVGDQIRDRHRWH